MMLYGDNPPIVATTMFFTMFKKHCYVNNTSTTASPERENKQELPPPYKLHDSGASTDFEHKHYYNKAKDDREKYNSLISSINQNIHSTQSGPPTMVTFELTHFPPIARHPVTTNVRLPTRQP